MTDIRFDGRVAIVTGAGRGLGRAYALELARRGARVVINDFGGARDGTGGTTEAAEAVVAEIAAAGGEAFAHGTSVTDEAGVADMVRATLERWGRIDVLIANAGVLRDKTFAKMELEDFRFVLDVHLMGAVIPLRALWDVFRTQNYGRVVVTTSSSGLYGNFGQSNYGAAKLALVGLMQTLKLEGAKADVRINAVAPVAATRMTEDVFPAEIFDKFQPEAVAPGVAWLASEDAPSGVILSAGAGVFAQARIVETRGVNLGENATAEAVRDSFDRIGARADETVPQAGLEQSQKILGLLAG